MVSRPSSPLPIAVDRDLGGRVEPVLGDDRDQRAGLPLGRDDLVGLRDGGLGRLLDDHVLAGLERLDRHLAVPAGRGADHDDVDVDGCKRLGERG